MNTWLRGFFALGLAMCVAKAAGPRAQAGPMHWVYEAVQPQRSADGVAAVLDAEDHAHILYCRDALYCDWEDADGWHSETAYADQGLARDIPLERLGDVATQQVKGKGLSITALPDGARLHCAFQRLEGQVTPQGLRLKSTTGNAEDHYLQIVAVAVGRRGMVVNPLPRRGTVSVSERLVRFVRPGVIEEYSVSVDGIRQDFLVPKPPLGTGELSVELALSGAQAEDVAGGLRLTLTHSARQLTYGRLHAEDARGRELPAHLAVLAANRLVVRVDDTQAVYPIRIDPTFSDADWISLNPGISGANGPVYAFATDTAGDLYVGGSFTAIANIKANQVARWDGNGWSALGTGLGSVDTVTGERVGALAVLGTDLYASGNFTTAKGAPADYLARWNGQTWSALGSGVNGYVIALAVMGNDLYVGGGFESAGGLFWARGVAKWDGSSWSDVGMGVNGYVLALAASETDLYVGGGFSAAAGGALPVNNIAKWDGSSWSALGSGTEGQVQALAISGTDLFAGGSFSTIGGIQAYNVAKWNGNAWSALGSGIEGRFVSVNALTVMGGNLYAAGGGEFETAGGVPVSSIAKWNGSAWSTLRSGIPVGGSYAVAALAVIGDVLYVGGEFDTAGGFPARGLAKWEDDDWSAVWLGGDGQVHALAVDDADLYVGGEFRSMGGVPANNVAKWNGSAWSALGAGVEGPVSSIAIVGSDIYAGGGIEEAGGVPARHIARWDGNTWSALETGLSGEGLTVIVSSLAAIGENLYAGGQFYRAGGVPVEGVAQWNGKRWESLGTMVRGYVWSLAAAGSDLYVAAAVHADGLDGQRVSKFDGGTWSVLGESFNGPSGPPYWSGHVNAMAKIGTTLYAGGAFTSIGRVSADHIARWNGSSWSALGSGLNGIVYAMAVCGNDLYVAGEFTTAGGTAAPHIAKWNGRSWSALGSGTDGTVSALAANAEGRLFVGGGFFTAGNKVSPYLAQANVAWPLLDHFSWRPILSPKVVNVPFPVEITARTHGGHVVNSFAGPVRLYSHVDDTVFSSRAIGSGAAEWEQPINTQYHDSRTQVIYLSSEVGGAGKITSVALEVTDPPGQGLDIWTIRMKHTTMTEYPTSPQWEGTGWTVVYRGDEPPGATGWRVFELVTPYDYDGSRNLLIDFSFNNASRTTAGRCRCTVQGDYRSICSSNDSMMGDPLHWAGGTPPPERSQNVPNVVLGVTHASMPLVTMAQSGSGLFVNGVWTGEITMREAESNIFLRALFNGVAHTGESNQFDTDPDSDGDAISDTWEREHFTNLTNVAFDSDWDGDGFCDGDEFHAGTIPTDSNSSLRITSVNLNEAGTEAELRWQSVSGRFYSVYCVSSLVGAAETILGEHLPAVPEENVYTDRVEGAGLRFYRVSVEP